MRNIVLISSKIYHYRVSIYNYLNRKLNSLGYELVVITNELQKENPHKVDFTLLIQPFCFSDYKREILRLNPVVVIFFLRIKDFIIWPLLFWLKSKNVKTIYWAHGVNLQTPNNIFKNVFFGILHAVSDSIVLYSRNEKKYVNPKYHYKVFIANNTINHLDIPDIKKPQNEIREEFNINFIQIVLFVGRILEDKRLDDLLEAARYLNKDIGVVVVGGGISRKQLKKIDKSHNILYLGEIYDTFTINSIFKMSDVFCIPGSCGLGINHAFYWRLPVVTECVRHSPEIVYLKNNYNGFIVQRGNFKMLAEKINYILSTKAVYERFSKAAREEFMRNGNIEVMCDGFISAINYLKNMQSKTLVN